MKSIEDMVVVVIGTTGMVLMVASNAAMVGKAQLVTDPDVLMEIGVKPDQRNVTTAIVLDNTQICAEHEK